MAVNDANPAPSETDNEKMDSLRQLPSESTPRRRASGDGLVKSDRHDEKASSTGTAANSSADDGKGKDAAVTVDEKKKADDAPPPVPFAQLFRFATKFELFLDAVGIVCAIGAGAAQPLMTLLFGNLTNAFVDFGTAVDAIGRGELDPSALGPIADDFKRIASRNALWLTLIGVAMAVATFTYSYFWVYTGEVSTKRVRERYLQAVLRQDIAFFDKVGAGEVATRIQTDTHLVQQGISEKVPISISFVAAFLTGFILAYARSWRLALALSSIIPVISIAGVVMNHYATKYMELSLKHVADGGNIAEEVISTVRTAKAFGTQIVLSRLYDSHVAQAFDAELKIALAVGIALSVFFFAAYAAYALAFSFGTTLILQGHADVGTVVNVFMAILIGSFTLAMLAPETQAITKGQAAAAKLFQTIDRVPDIDSEDPSGLKPDNVVGDITFEHVNFNYPARPDVTVLKDFSIRFPPKKTCALVGASGSGKSTVVALIERFYDPLPDGGVIKLDGIPLKDLNLKWLRSQIGLVSQEPVLFSTTIRANVAHGLTGSPWENASHDEKERLIKEACIKANADGFISKLPDGYDTLVGERGFLLSGGQKQRVAIARAIVSDPRILLLDEATSALDTTSEAVVQDALDKAAAGRTTITIAHRLSTIKGADCIFVMGNGELLEQGTHAELLRDRDGPYSRLVHAQKLREEEVDTEAENTPPRPASPMKHEGHHVHISQSAHDVEKDPHDETPFRRQGTQRSLASDILEQRKKEREEQSDKSKGEYGTVELFKRMGAIQRGVWKQYLWGVINAILVGMVHPAFAIVFAFAVTSFQTNDRRELRREGDRNALWFFIISLVAMLAVGLQQYAFSAAAANLTYKLRSISFRSILRQDVAYFDDEKHSTGSLTSRLSDNPQKISGLAGVTLGAIVQAIATVIVGWIIGLAFQWKLAIIGIVTTPILISAGYIRLRVVVMKDEQNKLEHEASAQVACEAAGSIRTVASLTREKDCCDNYSSSLEEPLRRSKRSALFSNSFYALSQGSIFFIIALVFYVGSLGVANQEYGTTAFFVAVFSTTFGAIQAGDVFNYVPDISSAKSATADLLRLIDSQPDIDSESTKGLVPKNPQGQIRFEGVHFRYPTRTAVRVLRDLNLNVEPGSYIALVGASGCGKSTIIQLIERFYDPLIGKIHLDGQDISELNVQEYRKNIALVSQEPTLYAGTIRFNVLLGATKNHEDVTDDDIEAACRDANILDFIKSLPQGFDTEVGGKGSQLSGGQKQRIAIARALVRNPKVLLLDEATSALDSESEKVVQVALDQAAKGRTTVAIAHRLSTIQNADCIYFVKDGRISESGTHDQLLALRGDYHEYVLSQALSSTTSKE